VLNQTNDGENIFDSKILEERPQVNSTMTKKCFTKASKPPVSSASASNVSSDSAKTLKKQFQTRNLKNNKNMMKYGLASGADAEAIMAAAADAPQALSGDQANTPPLSTADTSLMTNKISSFFQGGFLRNSATKKNPGHKGVYLNTIESEEVGNTEENCSSNLTQQNDDTQYYRKSFIANNAGNSSRESSLKSFGSASNPKKGANNSLQMVSSGS